MIKFKLRNIIADSELCVLVIRGKNKNSKILNVLYIYTILKIVRAWLLCIICKCLCECLYLLPHRFDVLDTHFKLDLYFIYICNYICKVHTYMFYIQIRVLFLVFPQFIYSSVSISSKCIIGKF